MAALQAEYLRQKSRISWGAEAFAEISPNISQDEKNLKLDTGKFSFDFIIIYYDLQHL
jgi:hypothetical protein